MISRELDFARVLKKISHLRTDEVLIDAVVAGGVLGGCMDKMSEDAKKHLEHCLEVGISSFSKNGGSLALLILQVALNTCEEPLYFEELKMAIKLHLTPP